MSNHAQTTSDIFVCSVLILFRSPPCFIIFFAFTQEKNGKKRRKNAREEEEANQPERRKKKEFFFLLLLIFLLTAECNKRQRRKETKENLCRKRRRIYVVGRHNLFLICFPFFFLFLAPFSLRHVLARCKRATHTRPVQTVQPKKTCAVVIERSSSSSPPHPTPFFRMIFARTGGSI